MDEKYRIPWKFGMSKNGGYFEIIDREGVLIAEVDFHDKYYRQFTRPLYLQHKAAEHAAIMSAAPEMLEALENLENDNNQIPEHAWLLVKEAIKKARNNN